MTQLSCKENLIVKVYKHPHYQSLNEKLMDYFSSVEFLSHKNNTRYTNIRGSQFYFVGGNVEKPKSIFLIEEWVKEIIRIDSKQYHSECHVPLKYIFGTWAARLDKGEETWEHDHFPFSQLAYVYFVNTPKGASPLVFPTSGKKVKAESGTLVLFPSSLRHKVPTNKCDNRITIASNINIIEKPLLRGVV